MADEATDAKPAESSAAVLEVPTGSEDYATWRMTGKLPEPKKADPAPAKESSESESVEGEEEGAEESRKAPESESGKKQERKPSKAEQRLTELLDDLRRAGLSPAELKTFKREAKAVEQPKPEHTEKPAGLEPPKKPKLEDFDSYEKYEEARDKYFEDLGDYKAEKRIEDFRKQLAEDAARREMQGKVVDAEKRYGAEARSTIESTANAVFGDKQILPAVKALVNDSPVLVDLLYVIGSKPEDLNKILETARTNPGAAIREIVLLEKLVQEELAKPNGEADRDESGKFKAPEKKVTQAPAPPKEVSGRGAVAPNEVESAAQTGDFTAFRNAANRRDLAKRKGF